MYNWRIGRSKSLSDSKTLLKTTRNKNYFLQTITTCILETFNFCLHCFVRHAKGTKLSSDIITLHFDQNLPKTTTQLWYVHECHHEASRTLSYQMQRLPDQNVDLLELVCLAVRTSLQRGIFDRVLPAVFGKAKDQIGSCEQRKTKQDSPPHLWHRRDTHPTMHAGKYEMWHPQFPGEVEWGTNGSIEDLNVALDSLELSGSTNNRVKQSV